MSPSGPAPRSSGGGAWRGRTLSGRLLSPRGALPLALALTGVAVTCGVAAALPLQRIDRARGLASSQVHEIAVDRDGVVWLATPVGLARYDGVRLDLLGRPEGLSTQGLRSVVALPEGGLLVGTDVGLDRVDPDGSVVAGVVEGWTYGFVDAISVRGDEVWLGTRSGLVRWPLGGGDPALVRGASGVVSELAWLGGELWLAGPAIGVARWNEADGLTPVELPGSGVGRPRAIATAAEGLWIGGDEGLIRVDASARPLERMTTRAVTAVLETGGELWLGTRRGGLQRWLGPAGERVRADQVAGVQVNQVTVGDDGTIWAATDSGGALKVSALRFVVASPPGACDTQVFSIRPDGDGYLIGGADCSWRLAADLSSTTAIPGLDGLRTWDLIRTRDGSLWAATQEGVLTQEPGATSWRPPTGLPPDGLEPARVLVERGESLWLGTVGGLFVRDSGGWSEIESDAGADLGYVYTLREDDRGSLWIGTIGHGLWREQPDGSFTRAAESEIAPTANVYALEWAGDRLTVSVDDRIVELRGDESKILYREPRGSVAAWSLAVTGDQLWAGGNWGLTRVGERGILRTLTDGTGLASSEFTTSRSLWVTADGKLICGTAGGLSTVDLDALDTLDVTPEVALGAVEWEDVDARAQPSGWSVPYGRWAVEIGLYAPFFLDEAGVEYRYRLHGFHDEWHEALRADLPLRFTALPPGAYRLEAQAFSPLVGWGPARTLTALRVARPWWLNAVTAPLWLALAVALVVLVWRARSRRLRAVARQLEGEVAARTDELRRLNSELERLAARDGLTGVANVRALRERAKELDARWRRKGEPYAVVVCDLDRFKQLNDRAGHPAGDAALVAVARTLEKQVRVSDLVGRWGGEEFVLLLSDERIEAARAVAERCRLAIRALDIELPDGDRWPLTASFGCATPVNGSDFETALGRADAALYRAKDAGRDRVEVASDEAGDADALRGRERSS